VPENLNWSFNLANGVAAPATDMAAALEVLTRKLQSTATAFDGFEKKLASSMAESKASVAKESGGLISSLGEVGLAITAVKDIAGPIFSAGGWALDKVFQFEKAGVDALAFKETTLASFETLLGSAEEAQAFFKQAAWLGKATPFQTRDVVEQFQRLLSSGFTKEEVPVVFQALGDAAALRGFDPQVMNHIGNALGHMMSNGFNEGSIRMLSLDAAGTGFSKERLRNKLAENLGLDPDSIDAMISNGEISARTGVRAFIDVMAEHAGGGMTGGGMLRLQDTFEGVKSTLESTVEDFFLTLDSRADAVQGFAVLKGAMINLRTALDTTTGSGKHLQDAVVSAFSNIASAMFGVGNGPDGLARMQQLIDKAAIGIENFGQLAGVGFEAAWQAALAFGDELGLTQAKAGGLFDGPLDPAKLEVLRTQLVQMAREAGTELAKFAKSLTDIAGSLETISSAINVVRTVDDYGRNAALGLRNIGHAIGGGQQEGYFLTSTHKQSNLDLEGNLLKAGPTMAKTPGAAAAALPNVTVTVNASGAVDPAAVGQAAGWGVRRALEDHTDAMRSAATQAGAQ
jgi:hypothetical protein